MKLRLNPNPAYVAQRTTRRALAIGLLAAIGSVACEKQTPVPAKASAQVEKVAPAPAIAALALLPGAAFGGVDGINGIASPKPNVAVPITGETIEIGGVYVDAVKGSAAAGVDVMIGDKQFSAVYGGERPDIAKTHNNPNYLKSQFYVKVPKSAVLAGVHDIQIKVIAADKSGYYASGVVAKIDVK